MLKWVEGTIFSIFWEYIEWNQLFFKMYLIHKMFILWNTTKYLSYSTKFKLEMREKNTC